MTRIGAASATALAPGKARSASTLAIVFRVQEAHYALRCRNIVEVIPLVALRPVPQASPWLLGVFAYRGQLTPVIDLCGLIGGYACPKRLSSRIMLVRCTTGDGSAVVAGFLAEHVTEARRIGSDALPAGPLSAAAYLAETLLENGELLQIVDEHAILASLDNLAGVKRLLPGPETDEENRSPSQS
ncbi:MAG TPA: chemotaxis protein CheW [Polyangiaceae bacterium]|nr:chemotaxis protein CheW [Polyangiaceae bacterium]